jgi:cytochrome P450
MGHWFQCYSFDVIACITFGQRFGFLDSGEDIDGIMSALDGSMKYSTLIGIFPRLHPLLFDFAAKFPWSGAQGRLYIMQFVQKQIERRRTERKARDEEKGTAQARQHDDDETPEDFLEKMMNANENVPEKVTAYHIFMMGLSNIIAGSDTTAISLSAILYYLVKNPKTMRKLKNEIAEFESKGQCGNPEITFKESQEMPYLQAVMKEALRLHPATGLPLWRVVPEGGSEISGRYFPAGSVLGINTWCAHYNEDVFGSDASEFRPERWIEAEKEDPSRLKRMDAYYMPFGLGSRTCLGRHISFLEMSKLIPRLVRHFDFELEHPGQEWKTENFWFVKPTNFNVRVKLAGSPSN